MTTLIKTSAAQNVMEAHFDFTMADAMAATSGTVTNFKATTGIFDVIPLPYGAQVVGGDFTVLVVSNDSGTAVADIGDSADNDRYSTSDLDLKTLGRTALLRTGTVITAQGYQSLGEAIRMTLANGTGDATAGSFRLTVQYIVNGRQNENLRVSST